MTRFDQIARNPEKFTVYSGEVMLRDFDGESVSVWLQDECKLQGHKKSPEHPEKGSRYLMVLVEIGDDEQPIDVNMREQFAGVVKEMVKPMTTPEKIVRQAALLCKDSDFHRFVYSQIKGFDDASKSAYIGSGVPRWLTDLGLGSFNEPEHAEEWCKYYLYYRCGVYSRKQLGFKKEYKDKFAGVLKDFNTWGRANGVAS